MSVYIHPSFLVVVDHHRSGGRPAWQLKVNFPRYFLRKPFRACTASPPQYMTIRSDNFIAAVTGYIKLALNAGKASPAPPVGPALGSKVSLMCNPIPPSAINGLSLLLQKSSAQRSAKPGSVLYCASISTARSMDISIDEWPCSIVFVSNKAADLEAAALELCLAGLLKFNCLPGCQHHGLLQGIQCCHTR